MDWKLCIICQQDTAERLKCPSNSTRKDAGVGYSSFVNNLQEFIKIDMLPVNLNIECLNKGQGLEKTLKEHQASWHKTCRDLFNNTKLQRAQKRSLREEQSEEDSTMEIEKGSPVKARRSSFAAVSKNQCIFCDKLDKPSNLRAASTLEIDRKVRECAVLLNDRELIAKVSDRDMVAMEAKYHAKCLISLYNRARPLKAETPKNAECSGPNLDELAFAELIAYVEERLESEDLALLKMTELTIYFKMKLEALGVESGSINTTRLKERILAVFPDLTDQSQGRDTILVSKHEIGDALKRAKEKDSEAWHLARAAIIIRRDIFRTKNSFNGTFSEDCQTDSVPASLKVVIDMILRGAIVNKEPAERDPSQACLTISQLIVFNCTSRERTASRPHHTREKECPVPIYTSLKIHGATRDKSLIDAFFKLGLCISYDRLLSVSSDIANKVIARYESENVVCPSKLRKGLFTTAAVDNIDHNPSSTSAQDSFHGTAISLVQHPTTQESGESRGVDSFDPNISSSKKIVQLPPSFRNVQPVTLPCGELYAPPVNTDMQAVPTTTNRREDLEDDWLQHVRNLVQKEDLNEDDAVSWAAYHASKASLSSYEPAIIGLLPMFLENAHSLAMILHSMNVVQSAVRHVSPSQTPVIAVDQPLFALAKQIQWKLVNSHGEDKFVVMFGGLHIEMTAFKVLGKWLDGSGWTEILTNAGVASQGVVDSFIACSHLKRTRRAHQVTAASLYLLQQDAYDEYVKKVGSGEPKPFKVWKEDMSKDHPQFLYWTRVLELELLCLQLVRSFREANFTLYLQSLKQIVPWMFALDNVNYARWLSVHIRDMSELPFKHPDVFNQFSKGSFVVHKTKKLFSAIALDHAHEQVNAMVKGEGGAVGLTENPSALRRWMIAGPEVARMVHEFERSALAESQKHHEQTPAIQREFHKDVSNVVSNFHAMGNPFAEESEDLFTIHTKDVMNSSVVDTVKNVVTLGEEQYQVFVKERFVERRKSVTEKLNKNSLATFKTGKHKVSSKDKAKVQTLKQDCALFSRLYIASQNRSGDLDDFFKYENQPWPPSLAQAGNLRAGNKADLIKCIELTTDVQSPTPDVIILDGAVIVQMLSPGTSETFEEYAQIVFLPYVLKQLHSAERVDLVWDVYKEDSLKKATREKRGFGQRRKVSPTTRIPSDWKGFLRVDANKSELFNFLAQQVISQPIPEGKEIYSTFEEKVLCSPKRAQMSMLEPCNHEEADTRLMVHVLDASVCGHQRIIVRTNDTDVVVLAVSIAKSIQANELWVLYGTGKHTRYLPAHTIASIIGPDKASVLPLFHAFTGCDTVSFFGGRGKKTAWEVWDVFPELTLALQELNSLPQMIDCSSLQVIERYVVLLYDRTSNLTKVNEARQELFAKKSRTLDNIPPTQEALLQHTKRAVLQGGFLWGQCCLREPVIPRPSDWGWYRADNSWSPKWTNLPQVKDACYELIRCGCTTSCSGRCKCVKALLVCTRLCNCGGDCQ